MSDLWAGGPRGPHVKARHDRLPMVGPPDREDLDDVPLFIDATPSRSSSPSKVPPLNFATVAHGTAVVCPGGHLPPGKKGYAPKPVNSTTKMKPMCGGRETNNGNGIEDRIMSFFFGPWNCSYNKNQSDTKLSEEMCFTQSCSSLDDGVSPRGMVGIAQIKSSGAGPSGLQVVDVKSAQPNGRDPNGRDRTCRSCQTVCEDDYDDEEVKLNPQQQAFAQQQLEKAASRNAAASYSQGMHPQARYF
mmetsp:Transcript_134817/g.234363  ORF Transcript_134817/g.234363 Transcript_134817/m.234363 type:complete len:245 (-) Transcript_134817:199-933(-)